MNDEEKIDLEVESSYLSNSPSQFKQLNDRNVDVEVWVSTKPSNSTGNKVAAFISPKGSGDNLNSDTMNVKNAEHFKKELNEMKEEELLKHRLDYVEKEFQSKLAHQNEIFQSKLNNIEQKVDSGFSSLNQKIDSKFEIISQKIDSGFKQQASDTELKIKKELETQKNAIVGKLGLYVMIATLAATLGIAVIQHFW